MLIGSTVFILLEGTPGINLCFARKLLIDLVVLNVVKTQVLA
jgi:hypothetical protein